jgi:hypothetical protein
LSLFNKFGSSIKGVRTAGIGPHIGEGDLLASALLEKKSVLRIEQENTEGAMEQTSVDVFHKMAFL